ncbi:ABC transporter permease [Rugosimonospora africana]|uniref:ABC transporter permease n=1 Tax=Rugosimonospora africana TaxID=556532 RepID=A0A8J3R1S2_9ACTN|nr:ABC-2 family transporter protein [Rugosimonospora africana]GIH19790.1 ABC transporter permease [Rugosimonospora africana]
MSATRELVAAGGRYAALARLQSRTVLRHRTDCAVGLIALVAQILLSRVVWTAVYGGRDAMDGVPLAMMLTYVALAATQHWLLSPWAFSMIPERVRDGTVGMDLTRPVSFIGQVVAGQTGRTVALLPFAGLALPIGVLLAGTRPPRSAPAALAYLLSLALAYLVSTGLSVVVGLLAFWTMEIHGLFITYRMVSQFLSGALVPLWLMPRPLREVARMLPFPSVTYTPTSIYVGTLRGGALALGLAAQVGWAVLLFLLARLAWAQALRRVVVQGG